MGWVVGGEQSIEYAVESAFANEADIANLDGKGLSGIWLPQGVAESRMRDRELITKSVIVGHESSKLEIRTFQRSMRVLQKCGGTAHLRGSESMVCSRHVPQSDAQYHFSASSVPVRAD